MSCYHPLDPSKFRIHKLTKPGMLVPCGQCLGCRLERSRQWAVRCMHEASLYERNCFVTLTYNQDHLPLSGSLDLSHFQLFMKRLRKKFGAGIRFYHCGEYGENLGRPHYHALLFNHDFEDKKYFSERNGHKVYTSGLLSDLWNMGHSVIGDVTFDSAAYVARYCMKKVTGEKKEVWYGPLKPEYTTMSRRPGIGTGWYRKFRSDVYPHDRIFVNGGETRPPRFYDGLLEKEDPTLLSMIKSERSKNEKFVVIDNHGLLVSDSSERRLLVKEKVKRAEISGLVRPLEAGNDY